MVVSRCIILKDVTLPLFRPACVDEYEAQTSRLASKGSQTREQAILDFN